MKPSITSTEEVSRGQKESCINLITDATRKAAGVAIDELVDCGVLNKQNIELVRARGHEVVAAITTRVKEIFAEIAENIVGIVKLISGAEVIELDETDGTETLANAKETFPGGIYGLSGETNVPSSATEKEKVKVSVHEMIKNGTFTQIFGGMSGDLDSLCLPQSQIIGFVKKHRKWLRTEGYATFFLFKVGNEFFVARVDFGSDRRLEVRVFRVSCGVVWGAGGRRRIVVPQLTLKS